MKQVPEQLLLYCRAGFEKECAAEISERAAQAGIYGYARTTPESAHVLFVPHEGGVGRLAGIDWRDLVFARQLLVAAPLVSGLPETNRIPPIAAAAATLGSAYCDVWLEHPDTNAGKTLSGFCKRFQPILAKALATSGLITTGEERRRLHVFFLDHGSAYVASADVRHAAPWPLGIPRLKMPGAAPSRSTLKLAEAFLVFLTPAEQEARLHEGLTAVDLGAAPGGWTWQLLRRGVQVTAVDNASLSPVLDEARRLGQLEHLRADGLGWRPRRPVHWLVCDMVEKPSRVAGVVADWIAGGHATEAIFNLKLPMKKRRDELERCEAVIEDRLDRAGLAFRLRFKQLYHDREEVTGHLHAET